MKTLKLLDRLSRNATLLFEVINELGNGSGSRDRGYIYASRQYMADRLHCSTRTITRAMLELKRAGYVHERRMGRGLNNRIYIAAIQSGNNEGGNKSAGTEAETICQVKSGQIVTSHNNPYIDKNTSTSIYPQGISQNDKTEQSAEKPAFVTPAGKSENSQDKRQDRTKHASTPRSPRFDRIARKMAARSKYYALLSARLKLSEPEYWAGNFCEFRDEYEAVVSSTRVIANAMSSGRKIAVNGALLHPEEYWLPLNAALTPEVIWEAMSRWNTARMNGAIRNPNAYLLAVIYNACVDRQLARDVV